MRCPRPGSAGSRSSIAAARAAQVIVPDYQLSLAIGKEGQNARLAARLTGWRIDIRSDAAVQDSQDTGGPRSPAGWPVAGHSAGRAGSRGRRSHPHPPQPPHPQWPRTPLPRMPRR